MKPSPILLGVKLALALLGLSVLTVATPARAEAVYFALEVRREGRLVASPKLLGETGRTVRAERRKPGAPEADYRLVLTPVAEGERYKVQMEMALPKGTKGQGELALLHGEERKLQLGPAPGDLEVSLMLMKVDSPEFRALMDLGAEATAAGQTNRSI